MNTKQNEEELTREQKINFLKEGEKQLEKDFKFARYSETFGDFSTTPDEVIDDLVEELDWIWK